MPHVVTERCVDCRYTDCCAVCPVECFWEVENPAMLVIDPQTCIDCGLCIPECPIYAIYPLDEVPEPYREWIKKNADLFPQGKQITVKKDALASAIPLAQIHEKEKGRGMKVADPSAVGGSSVTGATAKKAEAKPAPKPAEGTAATAAAVALTPQEIAAQTLKKKLAAAGAAPPQTATTGPAGYRPSILKLPPAPQRPPLDIYPGGRLRLGFRTGTLQALRRGPRGYADARILFDGDQKPTWYVYSSLQTFKEKGELTVLEPGRKPGFLGKFFGA